MGYDNRGAIPILDYLPAGGRRFQVIARMSGELLHSDTLDPGSDTARQRFVKAAVKAILEKSSEVDAKMIQTALLADLLRISDDIARGHQPDAVPDGGTVDDEASPELCAEVNTLLEDANLLMTVCDDIAELGVAGERELTATLYLTGVSRLLDRPLAVIVQGPSSSGKSFVIEKTASLMPPEAVIYATQLTPQALFHMPPGSLSHRFVVAGERSRLENDETAEATRGLREMLSAGRLSKLMPLKVGGEIQTMTIEQEGPIAFAESTTLTHIFDEDANRCLLLSTDEQQEQTQRIIRTAAAVYSGKGTDPARKTDIVRRHHHLQRALEPVPVVIPFADLVGDRFGVQKVEARRAFPQVMNMVQSLALLHQRQRRRDSNGAIVADVRDYELARWLLLRPLLRYTGGLSDGARRFFDTVRARASKGTTFTTTEAKKWEASATKAVYSWLTMLQDAGLLELVEEGRGRTPAKWKLTGNDIAGAGDGADLLPTVDDVARSIHEGHKETIPN